MVLQPLVEVRLWHVEVAPRPRAIEGVTPSAAWRGQQLVEAWEGRDDLPDVLLGVGGVDSGELAEDPNK